MEQQPLRQPRTFWQWLTNQEGDLWMPPQPPVVRTLPPRTALDALESQLERIMNELGSYNSVDATESPGYLALINSLDKLHAELARRSQEELNVNSTKQT